MSRWLMAAAEVGKLLSFSRQYHHRCRTLLSPPGFHSNSVKRRGAFFNSHLCISTANASAATITTTTTERNKKKNKKKNKDKKLTTEQEDGCEEKEKRRTRSAMDFDLKQQHYNLIGLDGHIPVMLGEVLQVFHRPRVPLRSFVDCTLGAAGHSTAIIQAHPELQLYVGLDVDPLAHEKAQTHMNIVLNKASGDTMSDLKLCTLQKNFKQIKSILTEVDETLLIHGVDGIMMDLGVSSMQVNNAERGFSVLSDGPLDMRMDPKASLIAEDILNSWPEDEVGRILRKYGEESNWRHLQTKIVKARLHGGLHSTSELVNLVRSMSPMSKGRQGWVKTATRVFQALRIAVNDELGTLEHALRACFDCLSVGGRLAVISFHSLEDRIVKQTFLDIINISNGDLCEDRSQNLKVDSDGNQDEVWVKQRIRGTNGTILTKRPITPSEEEENVNRRCRSAKLRVIQKIARQ